MELFNSVTFSIKNTYYLSLEKITNGIESMKKLYNTVHTSKKEQISSNNNIIIGTFTLVSLILTLGKIVYKKLKYKLDRYNKRPECTYIYHGKRYRLYFKKQKYYNSRIIEAHDLVTNRNIVDYIKEYAGPYENFHRENITPGNLGYEHIRITTMNGLEINVKEFKKDELIVI